MEPLKVAILTGIDTPWISQTVSSIARLAGVDVVGVLVDMQPPSFAVRLRNFRRNLRREGLSYAWRRLGAAVENCLETCAARVVSNPEVDALMKAAFPDRPLRLDDLREQGIPLFHTRNLNGANARETLRRLAPDVGVVLGTRILKRATFAIPGNGCLNLHLGQVPEYRGLPPGFWELYEGRTSAGATVHFVDDGLDTGEVVGELVVPIDLHDDPDSLRKKLEITGTDLLLRCMADLSAGRLTRTPQRPYRGLARTKPTRRQSEELRARLRPDVPRRPAWLNAVKTLLYLFLYYSGTFQAVRRVRRLAGRSRACVLVYHRVNDVTEDPLTTNVKRFAEHLVALRQHCRVMSSSELIERLCAGRSIPPDTVVIHFDDCYRDVLTHAAPLLASLRVPACCFVSSGYVGTDRRFPHDSKCPSVLENFRAQDLPALMAAGIEIGAHTVNHADLGACDEQTAAWELAQSKRDLEALVGASVRLFSFPFGKKTHTRQHVRELCRQAGYRAMFSCHGGYVSPRSDPFDLPRVGVSNATRPLDLLLEIEGLSLGVHKRRWNSVLARRCWPSSTAIASPARPGNC